MSVEQRILQSLDLFEAFTGEDLETVAQLMHAQKVSEAEELIRRGDRAHSFYIVLKGNFMLSFAGQRAITLHKRGDIMGWSTLVPPHEYKGTAVALTDSEVLTLSGEEFLRLIQSNTALGDKVMKKIDQVAKARMPLFSTEPAAG